MCLSTNKNCNKSPGLVLEDPLMQLDLLYIHLWFSYLVKRIYITHSLLSSCALFFVSHKTIKLWTTWRWMRTDTPSSCVRIYPFWPPCRGERSPSGAGTGPWLWGVAGLGCCTPGALLHSGLTSRLLRPAAGLVKKNTPLLCSALTAHSSSSMRALSSSKAKKPRRVLLIGTTPELSSAHTFIFLFSGFLSFDKKNELRGFAL